MPYCFWVSINPGLTMSWFEFMPVSQLTIRGRGTVAGCERGSYA